MPKYIKRKYANPEKTIDGNRICVECGNDNELRSSTEGYMGFTIACIKNTDDEDNDLDINDSLSKLYIHAVCNHCSTMNVFIYKHVHKKGRSTYKLSEIWQEIADSEDE